MRLYCCILKGKTTTDAQFNRFVESFHSAYTYVNGTNHIKICPFFFVDNDYCVKLVYSFFGEEAEILKRDDDPGEIRNEFLARMQMISGAEEYDDFEFFTFFDGDDEICKHYFYQNYGAIIGRGFAIGNPVAVYGDEETDRYPLKWCLTANNEDVYRQTLLDKIGGQCWGRTYEMNVAKEAKFGRGLFEDVTFMYSVTQKYRNPVMFWDMEYYWHRDNPDALTRSTSTVAQIRDGMDNLDRAKSIALKDYSVEDPEVYRRYTIGVLVLIRNSAKTKNGELARKYILSRLDRAAFKAEDILESEPKFKAKLLEDFPDFIDWCSTNMPFITFEESSNESNENSARRPRRVSRKSDTKLEKLS